ncbi:hypothetical protein HR060_05165 [Catenovulum sp. SM1970]|uniref:hypothetical protein n=1 Tax=Marinifaba aquimaris TaxID=2741323 RepID=UPI001573B812|nr:hypothetical protein [Marinifaba aquimaris]NTS76252.1 hypothetical protein [Marinifaba aquimaris]
MLTSNFLLQAKFSQRLNLQINQIASQLTLVQLEHQHDQFSPSILSMMNRILATDMTWLMRFAWHNNHYQALLKLMEFKQPQREDEILYLNHGLLASVRKQIDTQVVKWLADEAKDQDFSMPLAFRDALGQRHQYPLGQLVCHWFNLQTQLYGELKIVLAQQNFSLDNTIVLTDLVLSNKHAVGQ